MQPMYNRFIESYNLIKESGVSNPLLETLRLFDLVSSGKISRGLSCYDKTIDDINMMAAERKNGVPMEYILGIATFMGKSFLCTNDTLIPTEETSLLVMTASDILHNRIKDGLGKQRVIEIGTGCGNISISLSGLCDDDVSIAASDISAAAVDIAKKNVERFGVQKKVALFCGDLFDPFPDHKNDTDMIVCNPPYIPSTSLRKLSSEIVDHEPMVALDGGPYGISLFRRLINESINMLKPGGLLIFEIGEGQEKLITMLFEKNKLYADVKQYLHEDKVRVISAIKC